jgi:alpha-D-ribose 1-methylphosphonate 5-triphosphate synthase subunit PhnI
MGYVAVRGGEAAIQAAAELLELLRCQSGGVPLDVEAIRGQLRLLTDRVCGEGGCWHPTLAALAIKQAQGDPLEAAFLLRAWRSTRPRQGYSPCHNGRDVRLLRRISAAFKEIPGGQILGPGSDYLQRLFRYDLLDETSDAFQAIAGKWLAKQQPGAKVPETLPKVLDALRQEGVLVPPRSPQGPWDLTRESLHFPCTRPAALAAMARGETGGLLAMAYSTMRGYGVLHPTVAELRYGFLPIKLPHPLTQEMVEIGEVPITECEVVSTHSATEGAQASFGLGYGCCFGHQEVKAIAMAMCDRAMQRGLDGQAQHPAEDPEFVLMHIDGIESMGFCSHYKLPHYVTFQSDLDALRKSRGKMADNSQCDSALIDEEET